jgi:hypothetical protein
MEAGLDPVADVSAGDWIAEQLRGPMTASCTRRCAWSPWSVDCLGEAGGEVADVGDQLRWFVYLETEPEQPDVKGELVE